MAWRSHDPAGDRDHRSDRPRIWLRIIPYLNVSFPGIFALSAAVAVGECADMRLLDPRECVRVIEANRDLIAGVKVRVAAGEDQGAGMRAEFGMGAEASGDDKQGEN